MAIVIQDGAILVYDGAIALDTDLCCDDCPAAQCFWDDDIFSPLLGTYSLEVSGHLIESDNGGSSGICDTYASGLGECGNAPPAGAGECEFTQNATLTHKTLACTWEDTTDHELCAAAPGVAGLELIDIQLEMEAGGANWLITLVFDRGGGVTFDVECRKPVSSIPASPVGSYSVLHMDPVFGGGTEDVGLGDWVLLDCVESPPISYCFKLTTVTIS